MILRTETALRIILNLKDDYDYDFIDFSSFFFPRYLTLSCGASGTVLQPEP